MLTTIQAQLEAVYRISAPDIRSFLIDEDDVDERRDVDGLNFLFLEQSSPQFHEVFGMESFARNAWLSRRRRR